MAKQTIILGNAPGDGTGEGLRSGGDKINDNFTELYQATDNIPEQVRDVIAAALTAGTNVSITVDDANDSITINASVSDPYTDEKARDAISAALVAGTNVTIQTDDAGDTITINASGGTGGGLDQEQAEDIVGSMFSNNTETRITATYDDVNGVINLVVDAPTEAEIKAHEGALEITEAQIADLAHFSGNYNDLTNKPDLSALNDVEVYANQGAFPGTGESDKVYIAEDTGYAYRWNGSAYTQLTDQTAIWGQVSGNLSDQTDLQNALDAKTDTGHSHAEYVLAPTEQTGNQITFDVPHIYNKPPNSPATGNLTHDLTGGELITQKIYHNDATAPSFPAEWIKIGSGNYVTGQLNIIYAEFVSASRVEYWITQ